MEEGCLGLSEMNEAWHASLCKALAPQACGSQWLALALALGSGSLGVWLLASGDWPWLTGSVWKCVWYKCWCCLLLLAVIARGSWKCGDGGRCRCSDGTDAVVPQNSVVLGTSGCSRGKRFAARWLSRWWWSSAGLALRHADEGCRACFGVYVWSDRRGCLAQRMRRQARNDEAGSSKDGQG